MTDIFLYKLHIELELLTIVEGLSISSNNDKAASSSFDYAFELF